jgi:putative two-component system response regulator
MRDLSECTILIVEDTETNVDILVDILGEDYEVAVAMDGESALETVHEEQPALILLDIMMPGMDGYEVFKRLKDNPATAHVPIIFISGLTEDEEKKKGLEMGAVDYIGKPFEASEIRSKVKKHLMAHLSGSRCPE